MKFKIVIISSDPIEAQEIARCFYAYGCTVCAIGTTGREALELVEKHQPDVLITDPFLPFYNCDDLAGLLEPQTPRMVKIALSSERFDRMAERFIEKGGDFFSILPLDYSYCLKRIEKYHLLRAKQAQLSGKATKERQIIRRLQMEMKMPISVNGFLYLQKAVELVVEDPQLNKRMISHLYPLVGAEFQASPQCVERCIRTVIANTFAMGDLDFLHRYFADGFRAKNGHPSNKEFIGRMAELVKLTASKE